MPIQTACPKCKKAYNLADNFLGKTVKCQACATPFLVRGPGQAVGAAASVAGRLLSSPAGGQPAQDLSRFDLDGPIVRKSTDIFSGSAAVSSTAPDPLANHVIADPGFTDGKTKKARKKDKAIAAAAPPPSTAPKNPHEKTGDHPVFENPFLASTAINRKKNPAATKVNSAKNDRLLKIGKHHKRILFSFLISVMTPIVIFGLVFLLFIVGALNDAFGEEGNRSVLWMVMMGLISLIGVSSVVFSIVIFISGFILADNLWPDSGSGSNFVISQFVPIWNLIALIQLDQESRKQLRDADLKVGLLGVKKRD